MKKLVVIFLLAVGSLNATVEYVSGYISYRYISGGLSFPKYELTLTLFTKNQKAPAATLMADGIGGLVFIDSVLIGNNIIKSRYQLVHTYIGPASFNIQCRDTINDQHVKNISLNSKTKFFISAQIIVSSFQQPPNDSYLQLSSPAIKVYKNKPFTFNPTSALTPIFDYDSLVNTFYSSGAYDPYVPSGVTMNRHSGEIQWQNPDTLGTYMFSVQTFMYKNGMRIAASCHSYKFDVINQNPSYIYDSINKVPLSAQNFKEIYYTAGNTYSFSAVYTDPTADSVKMITYPLDFFTTAPLITVTKNNIQKNTLAFSWSPVVADERLYPYNFVLQSISYYPNDSVANSYQTVSFKSSRITGIKENEKIKSLVVYPNPTNSTLNISDEQNELQHASIEITNSIGQTVITIPFNNSLDVSSLSNGCYFLNITTERKQVLHSKFIKG